MTRLLTFFLLLCVLATPIYTQVITETQNLRRIYEQATLMPSPQGFMKNGVVMKVKPFQDPLKKELKQTPEAYDRYTKGKRQMWGGIGTMSLGIILSNASAFSFPYIETRNDLAGGLSILATGQTLIFTSGSKINRANTNIQNAMWLHNRALILNEVRKNTSLDAAKIADLYDRNTIQFSANGFYQNGRYQELGFMNKNLTSMMQGNTLALAQMKKAKTNKIIGTSLSIASVAMMVFSITKPNNNKLIFGNGWYWGGFGASLTGSYFNAQSGNQIAKAAWFYNRDAFAGN